LFFDPANLSIHKILNINDKVEHDILFKIRLPKVLLGFAVGGALSISGVILQGLFRNPLVEPYTLGISGGAGLGVCINILFKFYNIIGVLSYPLFGFMGALIAILLIYYLNIKNNILKINEMLLTGVMISFIASSLIMLIMSLSKHEDLTSIIYWTMGSLDESNFFLISFSIIISIICLFISYFFSLNLNAMILGDEEAHHLGINVEKTKIILFFITSILTGLSVSICGVIGFIGLIVPHFVRLIFGNDYRILLITSFIAGAIFLILCETIARSLFILLPIGVVSGIIGGTLFIYLLSRRKLKI
jgi:iron complex transport system permease protein